MTTAAPQSVAATVAVAGSGPAVDVLYRLIKRAGAEPVPVPAAGETDVLTIEALGAGGSPGRLVGVRAPAPWLDFVELVASHPTNTETTAQPDPAQPDPAQADALARAEAVVAASGFRCVRLTEEAGPVTARLLYRYCNRAAALLADAELAGGDIDLAMRLGAGVRVGPIALIDQIGPGRIGEVLGAAAHPLLHAWPAGAAEARRPVPVVDADAAPNLVGVVGSGTMAMGIAEVLVAAGLPTVVVARTPERAEQVSSTVTQRLARRPGVDPASLRTSSLLRTSSSLGDLADCDLVIEAIVEDLAVKQALFADLARQCVPHAVLATTTSSLSIGAIAAATSRPGQVIGAHFFNPVPAMPLVEVVRAGVTDEAAAHAVLALCAVLGKTVVECGDRPGFIVNALLFPYLNDAVSILAEGHLSPDEIDRAMRYGAGFPVGPLRLLDAIGSDVALAIQRSLGDPTPLLERLVAEGYLGFKVGRGVRDMTSR